MNKIKLPRRRWLTQIGLVLSGVSLSLPASLASSQRNDQDSGSTLKLGAFSISLNVRNLQVSKEFYEALGFRVFAGSPDRKYLIMKNGNALIGLFEGMFEKNMLTFNPGWDENAQKTEPFNDVREIQRMLKKKGIKLLTEADETTTGPASCIVLDPDGNPVLLDQHR